MTRFPEKLRDAVKLLLICAIAATLVVCGTIVAVEAPIVLVAIIAAGVLAVATRSLATLSLLFLLAGPLLGSRFTVGPLTLDNWLSLGGIALAVIWALSRRRLPVAALSALPLLLALAITFSGLANGTEFLAADIRYLGVACIPALLIGEGRLGLVTAERVVFALVGVGAVSVIAQPLLPFIPVYADPDTGIVRFGGLFGHPNFAACVMCLAILYLIGRGSRTLPGVLLGVVLAWATLTTGSLGAIAALLIGVVVISTKRVGTTVGALVVGLALVAIAGATLVGRIEFFLSDGSDQNSLTWRFQRWHSAIGLVDQPNLFGIGWQEIEDVIGGPAHSSFVAIYVELGIVGAVLVAIGVLSLVRSSPADRFTVAMAIFILISSATDPILFYPSTLAMWVAISAMRVARERDPAIVGSVTPPRPGMVDRRAARH